MDLLLGGVDVKAEIAKEKQDARAPVELMSAFLMHVTNNRMKDAMELGKRILEFEPNNELILEYQSSLKEYIHQGLDVEESDSDKENDIEEDVDDVDEEKDASDEESEPDEPETIDEDRAESKFSSELDENARERKDWKI